WLGWAMGPNVTRMAAPTGAAAAVATSIEGLSWEPWTPEKQAALLSEGRPVFVDFTAAWCVTCQYNKRTTLANGEVLADLATKNVALLRADWTRRDPAVTKALAALGRNGVPVYVLLQQGAAPLVMSEVLSVDDVRGALATL
ncbi:MAG TPA: thioredoxin family protein, partial [Hydrogenophaga sp.]